MEAVTALMAAKFVRSIAQFGDQLSRVVHSYDTIEEPRVDKLSGFLVQLGASVHVLNQVGKLLEEEPTLPVSKSALFSQDGLDFVSVLAEECSVALCRAKFLFEGISIRGRDIWDPRRWESSTSVDEKGQMVFKTPILDETELFRQLTDVKWYKRSVCDALMDVNERVEKLHLLLLLVVQVVTVREMTSKTPLECIDLKSIVQYHSRIERTADLANMTSRGRIIPFGRSRSSSLSYYSDSDYSERSIRPRRMPFKSAPPPPPPPASGPVRPISASPKAPIELAPGFIHSPEPGLQIVDISLAPPKDFITLKDVTPQSSSKDRGDGIGLQAHPPSYCEKDATKGALLSVPEKSDKATALASSRLPSTTAVSKISGNESEQTIPMNTTQQAVVDSPRLLASSSGLGMKFKSLFRSKTSLEAEMKRTLAGDNASLAAYLIHGIDFFQVPHSAFHSLEYTHMRTILSQLQDNTWFKTFSDLRDVERDTLNDVTRPRREEGKWYSRELVVLKVMQQNRLNAWVRVFESCLRLRDFNFLPQHENSRIILAIVRDTECKAPPEPEVIKINDNRKPSSGLYPPQRNEPPRMLAPLIGTVNDSPPLQHPVTGSRMGVQMANAWSGPGGPPPPPGAGFSNFMSCQRADVTPKMALDNISAREALTTYKSYSLRPVTPHTSPTDAGPPPKPVWTRCFVTLEHDPISVIQERIADFNRRGDSVIDLKMQLTESQSAQLSRLIDESNRLDCDRRYEHKIVEISMVDRERGLVKRQTMQLNVNVIHVVLERSVKDNLSPLTVYNSINAVRPIPLPPSCGPPIIITERGQRSSPIRYRGGRRGSVSSYYSGESSDSNSDSLTSDSSLNSRRCKTKARKGNKKGNLSESDDKNEKTRWKRDPITLKFDKADKKKDVVELLLDRWTPAGEGKERIQTKKDDEEKSKMKKSKKTKKTPIVHYSDSDD